MLLYFLGNSHIATQYLLGSGTKQIWQPYNLDVISNKPFNLRYRFLKPQGRVNYARFASHMYPAAHGIDIVISLDLLIVHPLSHLKIELSKYLTKADGIAEDVDEVQ